MKNILISWVAFNTDFNKSGEVDIENSPNYQFHKYFFDHDLHIILSAGEKDDLRTEKLANKIKLDYPEHLVETRLLGIQNVIDLTEIKPKVEKVILEYTDEKIDIFFSPGTSIMQVSWYICHTSLGLNTRLLQVKPARFTKTKEKPELVEIVTDLSHVPITSVIKERSLAKRIDSSYTKGYKITKSIKPIFDRAYMLAQTDKVTTIIYGESGTGKEFLAQYIHENSIRKDKPFITINCSAFNDTLLESRLFGYKKGAFTGADKDTKGLFEESHEGTIFLDEIGDISSYMQQSLLRVIQSGEIQPLGGKSKTIDVRIIAATNKNLPQLCNDDKFRWDLYYRLAVVEIALPSLINRGKEEIIELIDHFLANKKHEMKQSQKLKFNKEALNPSLPPKTL